MDLSPQNGSRIREVAVAVQFILGNSAHRRVSSGPAGEGEHFLPVLRSLKGRVASCSRPGLSCLLSASQASESLSAPSCHFLSCLLTAHLAHDSCSISNTHLANTLARSPVLATACPYNLLNKWKRTPQAQALGQPLPRVGLNGTRLDKYQKDPLKKFTNLKKLCFSN